MPISLAELTGDLAHVTVVYNGHAVEVEYAPGLVTERALADMMEVAQRGQQIAPPAPASKGKRVARPAVKAVTDPSSFTDLLDFTASLNHLIARLVRRWDLTENDGVTMYPLTEDRLAELPLNFRRTVIEGVFGNLRMDPQ